MNISCTIETKAAAIAAHSPGDEKEVVNIYPTLYTPADDLWVISCYFNPLKYESRKRNFDIFYEVLKSSTSNYVIVECADSADDYHIAPSPNVIHLRNEGILWQKERLLNIAIARLPDACKKIAWLDCDVLFTDPQWMVKTAAMLDKYKIIQPYSNAILLPREHYYYRGQGDSIQSFAKSYIHNPASLLGNHLPYHGHTGYAWAAQASVLKQHGLYEGCMSGVADHYMAHAFCGDWDGGCVKKYIAGNMPYYKHFTEWATAIYAEAGAKVSYITGTLLHLWHGEIKNRGYYKREAILNQMNYNPYSDLKINADDNCLTWNRETAELENWAKELFHERYEDG